MILIKFLLLCLAMAAVAHGNPCVSFTVGPGTGCSWMCNYCATNLNSNNYYFLDNVCTYQSGQGCVGNPVAGHQYTCCVASNDKEL